MRRVTLGAQETTDILLLDFSPWCPTNPKDAEALVTTLARALQIGGARQLDLDVRELGAMAVPRWNRLKGTTLYAAVLYDNVPGGAGHVLALKNAGRDWLKNAHEQLFRDADHNERCQMACMDCLLTFDTQNEVDWQMLNRRAAYDTLNQLLV